jgi:predicted dehydrogenase
MARCRGACEPRGEETQRDDRRLYWKRGPGMAPEYRAKSRFSVRLESSIQESFHSKLMQTVGIIMNGVTGRMGANQHLKRSILAIREQGGLTLRDGTKLMPEPVLVGRNAAKLESLANECGVGSWTTDLVACLADPKLSIYFDAQSTLLRAESVQSALAAGKHVYCEKPLTSDLESTLLLAEEAERRGVRAGVVQDKLFLPGIRKLKALIQDGFFGRILSVRGEFGYWVFEGEDQPAQRPSWNYRKEDGGGITMDMFAHWQYVLENLFGPITELSARGVTHIPRRIDEAGKPYDCTADDAVYATFQLEEGIIAHMNSSWDVRVYRDDLLTLQVDGTSGSAVAGLRECKIQPRSATPRAVWNPDIPSAIDYFAGWEDVPGPSAYDNAFKVQWEMFLRHVAEDAPFPHDFREAARGVQIAELGLQSSMEKRWIASPRLPKGGAR